MVFRLAGGDLTVVNGGSLLVGALGCYGDLGDTEQNYSLDEALHERSAYEFVRSQLSVAQRSDLDVVYAYWRSFPVLFNVEFAALHSCCDRKTELGGFVEDENGNVPEIPDSHWWWWPLPDA